MITPGPEGRAEGVAIASAARELQPARLAASVALVAAAMLLVELLVTRLFSVMFYYHYSFFAVSLVMSGLTLGGLLAAALRAWGMIDVALAWLATATSAGVAAGLLLMLRIVSPERCANPRLRVVALIAILFLPGLTAAGAFLALCFARGERIIGKLYAADMVAASIGCVAAIPVLRTLQGPAGLLVPIVLSALAAAILGRGAARGLALTLALAAALAAAISIARPGRFFRLHTMSDPPDLERWNEHSRVVVYERPKGARIVIDRSAATTVPYVRERVPGTPITADSSWDATINHAAYRIGRRLERVAILGVGGGRDIRAGLAHGAHVDGYELNGIIVDLLRRTYVHLNPIATWPEVTLRHGEARVSIAHAGVRYDIIQASLTDTWAATAGGGFVLSESGLYTVEGWRTFLGALTESGFLTMTRWYLPEAPAETQRLVALAAAALQSTGIPDARSHVVLLGEGTDRQPKVQPVHGTIIVSKAPFSRQEIERLDGMCAQGNMLELVAPYREPTDPVLAALLAPETRAAAIAASPYDITPPSDERPYFFLQLRPRDVMRRAADTGHLLDITFRAVRVMVLLVAMSWLFAAVVIAAVALLLPRTSTLHGGAYRSMVCYFLSIGFGYIAVQLGLHQRLILILGHPTLALSVVLSSMLLGTGIGSLLSARLFPEGTFHRAHGAILAVLAAAALSWPYAGRLEGIESPTGRAAAASLILGTVGLVLGFGFPLGVRLVTAIADDRAVPRMWAVNGAASIAGSATAAVVGLTHGSRALVLMGLGAYVVAAACGRQAHLQRH